MTKTFIDLGSIAKKPLAPIETPKAMRARIKKAHGEQLPATYDERTTELLTMLRAMRPAGSKTEQEFVAQWITPLGCDVDGYGNHWKVIGQSDILWSCHTDTVHRKAGAQYVGFSDGCAYVTHSSCLGADDTTGVWLMRQMILANVPGTYVFHREEEIGGLGSSYVLQHEPERLAGLKFAIAFDRKGYGNIIVDQMGETASTGFAESLAESLWPLSYSAADGVFTDTQVYSGVIPECSNISVGYHAQHTSGEWQDIDFAMRLLDRLLTADFTGLRCERDPDAIDDYDESVWRRDLMPPMIERDSYGAIRMTMDDFCKLYPDVVSDFLTSCGYDVDELKNYGGMA